MYHYVLASFVSLILTSILQGQRNGLFGSMLEIGKTENPGLQVLKNTTVLYVLILYWCVNENCETTHSTITTAPGSGGTSNMAYTQQLRSPLASH